MKKMTPKMHLPIIILATLCLLATMPNTRAEDPMLKGLSWYGLDASPTAFRLNLQQCQVMKEQFPSMNFLCLPFSANKFTEDKLTLLKQIVQFCGANGIKVLIINYYQSRDWSAHTNYWKRMAQEFKGNSIIAGFDLLNEPWAFDYGDTNLPRVYEKMIDDIRAIDPERTCYVQSYLQHWQGYTWIRTNPIMRQNIVYVTHIYSLKNKNTDYPSWDTNYAWVKYYVNRQYSQGKIVLYDELYKRFIFAVRELGVRFAVPEVATIDTAEGLQYFRDLADILAKNNIDWAYHQYYTDQDRPISLTYPSGTLRPKASTVNTCMASTSTSNSAPTPTINSFTVSRSIFSPNDDGTKDTTTINAAFNVVVKWSLQIRNSLDVILRNWTGAGDRFSVVWDGKNNAGSTVPDDSYSIRLSGTDLSGMAFATTSVTTAVDTELPEATGVSLYPTTFSPRAGQTTKISYVLSESCYVTIKVYNSAGTWVRTLVNNVLQTSGAKSVTWNGKTSSGTAVPAGTFAIRISVVDRAGNKAIPYPATIRVRVT